MLAGILEGIFSVIFELVSEIVGYHIGRFVVLIFSFGLLKCDAISSTPLRRKLRWPGLFYRRGQQIYLTVAATTLIGILVLVLAVGAGFLIYFSSR